MVLRVPGQATQENQPLVRGRRARIEVYVLRVSQRGMLRHCGQQGQQSEAVGTGADRGDRIESLPVQMQMQRVKLSAVLQ